MPNRDADFNIPPIVAMIEPISEVDATKLCESFLHASGVTIGCLDLTLHIKFLAVFWFTGQFESGEVTSGWVVGGRAPHLELNDEEISTPFEALAIYVFYLRDWIAAKGISTQENQVPDYRIPPDWDKLSLLPGFKESKLGNIQSFIAWTVIPKASDQIRNETIREMCVRRGWIRNHQT